jgi:hypothetical protein
MAIIRVQSSQVIDSMRVDTLNNNALRDKHKTSSMGRMIWPYRL